jgi:hypothetical protein
MNLIKEIEELRGRQRLTKTVMAAKFGVIFQNYNNWIARSSLPKEHYERAYELLEGESTEIVQPSPEDEEFISKFRDLDEDGKLMMIKLMNRISPQ